ncbi:DoxX-like family protein [Fictibacillus nanhaiensis]|uniref:DoxX-like family protein n=1 Tax=Fictibacillus nanhaiensis TaxID=742169 RepID=UPI001C93AFAF|nr:DoxX-like family protein [Fictibacillus nanhaiensis]MBY6037130.1 DoxX-like family protein [Fictibacillus nanhaiensis]
MKNKSVYVEIPIEVDVKEVWDKSQKPDLHEQWDLRFSSITYLPKKSEDDPQSFLYETKIGLGLKVAGWGRSIGTHNKEDGSKISSLHFGTDQKISPISEGKGYWKYIPTEQGTTFLTQYDYDVRYGLFGRLLDFFFRPMIGWATALSFDVLKRWLEKGELPRTQYLRFFSSTLVTLLFFFVWFYQGLVPKIIAQHPEEVAMLSSLSSLKGANAVTAVGIIGVLEMLFGLLWLFYRKKRHLHLLQILVFPALTISALIADPSISYHPFNPVTFNSSLWILSIIGYILTKDLPTATSCKRTRKSDA